MKPEKEPPGIVVLHNATYELIKGEPRDLLADRGVIECAIAVYEALEHAGYRVRRVPYDSEVELVLADYPSHKWMVFNLAEGLAGRLFEEPRIAWALEAMGYNFTGSKGDALARSLNKARAKQVLTSKGVSTPAWWLFHHPDEIEANQWRLPFPLIVKPVAEDASIGLDSKAVVHNLHELIHRVSYVVEQYRQAALVESFIAGREFNVALWGKPPRVLPLAEIDFSAFADPHKRIVSFAAKWEQDSFEYNNTPVLCPAPVESELQRRIQWAAKRAWSAIGCRGYARVDIRVDQAGTPFVIEVNCNPDISPDAGFARAAQTAGYSYREMVVEITERARSQDYVEHRASASTGWTFHPSHNGRSRRLQPH